MNYIIKRVLNAIESERPHMADWCEDKRNELQIWERDYGKLEQLRWVVNNLDETNQQIAAHELDIKYSDLEPLGRVLNVI